MGGHFIEFIGFLSGPVNFVYYWFKIKEQKIFFEKNQISAFAPQKTGQKSQKLTFFQLFSFFQIICVLYMFLYVFEGVEFISALIFNENKLSLLIFELLAPKNG